MSPPSIFWVTGLEGAGKSTIGRALWQRLRDAGRPAVLLDGDALRAAVADDLGHDREDRLRAAMRHSRTCRLLAEQGLTVVCATQGVPGGYCTIACGAADPDGPGCPAGSACTNDAYCLPPCTQQGACSAEGDRCIPGAGCVPACADDADCEGARNCAPAGTCLACQANDVTCDGVDEDCDGGVDEDYVSLTTTCGVGACSRSGSTVCSNGSATNTCVAGAPAGDDATCDGIDDDCDGVADEGVVCEAPPWCQTPGACAAMARP